jgi:hypothetical protein
LLQEYPTRPRAQRERERERERERDGGGVVFGCVGVWVWGFFCSNVSVEDAIEVLGRSLVHKVG